MPLRLAGGEGDAGSEAASSVASAGSLVPSCALFASAGALVVSGALAAGRLTVAGGAGVMAGGTERLQARTVKSMKHHTRFGSPVRRDDASLDVLMCPQGQPCLDSLQRVGRLIADKLTASERRGVGQAFSPQVWPWQRSEMARSLEIPSA